MKHVFNKVLFFRHELKMLFFFSHYPGCKQIRMYEYKLIKFQMVVLSLYWWVRNLSPEHSVQVYIILNKSLVIVFWSVSLHIWPTRKAFNSRIVSVKSVYPAVKFPKNFRIDRPIWVVFCSVQKIALSLVQKNCTQIGLYILKFFERKIVRVNTNFCRWLETGGVKIINTKTGIQYHALKMLTKLHNDSVWLLILIRLKFHKICGLKLLATNTAFYI